ncbi:CHAT domain-containing protein, partial [Spirulina subsalsa FACHB-351]
LTHTPPQKPSPTDHPPHLIGHPTTRQTINFAQLETDLIHHLYPTSQLLTADHVTPAAFRQTLQTPAPFLHFTGHGEHDPTDPMKSALLLSHDKPFTLEELWDIEALNLPLICLGACETGITNTEDFINEFVGFPAIFRDQGSQFVLSTLWTVDEDASMIFVVEFFRHYQTHQNPVEALHHAQTRLQHLTWQDLAQWYREAIQPGLSFNAEMWCDSIAANIEDKPEQHPPDYKPYATPYHWASFVLHGDVM